MRSLSQFLEDFVYTTQQNKTDQHVKNFVKNYIKQPEVELYKNGVLVHGVLDKSFEKDITFNSVNKGIAITTTVTKDLEKIVTEFVGNMVDDRYVDMKVKDTKSETFPEDDDTINKTVTSSYGFTSESFLGTSDITFEAIVDKENKVKSYGCTIQAKWGVKTK